MRFVRRLLTAWAQARLLRALDANRCKRAALVKERDELLRRAARLLPPVCAPGIPIVRRTATELPWPARSPVPPQHRKTSR